MRDRKNKRKRKRKDQQEKQSMKRHAEARLPGSSGSFVFAGAAGEVLSSREAPRFPVEQVFEL